MSQGGKSTLSSISIPVQACARDLCLFIHDFQSSLVLIEFHSVYKQTYKPCTLAGPTVTRPIQDPLAVLYLKYRLYIHHPNNIRFKPLVTHY